MTPWLCGVDTVFTVAHVLCRSFEVVMCNVGVFVADFRLKIVRGVRARFLLTVW